MPRLVTLTSTSRGSGLGDVPDAELGGQLGGPLGRAVPDRHLGARLAQRPDRRAAGAARAEHERALTPRRSMPRASMSPPASVLSPRMRPSSKRERVDRADRGGRLGQLVGEVVGGDLVGDRHVGAEVARAGQGADDLVEPVRRHRQPHVAPVEPELAEAPRSSSPASGCARPESRGRPRAVNSWSATCRRACRAARLYSST